MTQSPYAQFNESQMGDFLDPASRRTSVLAILALIAGLLCFLPVTGALAVIFGGASIIFITRSNGRLGGTGLAITGIVLGLLSSVVWVAVFVGLNQVGKSVNQAMIVPINDAFTAMAKGDHLAARTVFTPKADSAVTDADLDAFNKKVTDEWGAFVGTPSNLLELVPAYMHASKAMRSFQNGGTPPQDTIPVPATFAKGTVITLIEIDPSDRSNRTGTGVNVKLPIVNIGVIDTSGKTIWLVTPSASSQLKSSRPSRAKQNAGDPATPEDPDDTQVREEHAPPEAPKPPTTPQ